MGLLAGLLRARKDPRRALKKVIEGHSLPSFPEIAVKALRLMRSESAAAAAVAETISFDPGLSVRILATVNSAAFALRRKVTNLRQAVALLGMSQLESLVISSAVDDTLPSAETRGYEQMRFWRASARRASAARMLADLLHPESSVEAFTAALLANL